MRTRPTVVLAVVLFALGSTACGDTMSPPARSAGTLSFDEIAVEEDISGSDAAEGETAFSMEAVGVMAAAAPSRTGVVVPNAYAGIMGNFNNRFPFAMHNMRYQQVFPETELAGLRAIGALCLRRDELSRAPALTQQITVKMGPTHLDHTNLGPVFDLNYAEAPTEVFSGELVLPATLGGGTPDDFYICIDFTTTYRHPAGANVIVEVLNTSASSTGHFEDACTRTPSAPPCTTRRAYAMSATATTAIGVFNSGLIVKFIGRAAGTTTTTNQSVPFDQVIFGCSEPIAFTGQLHVLIHETTSASGNLRITTHFQPQGVTGTGLITETKYQATGVTQRGINVQGPLPYTETVVNNFRLIGAGPDDNRLVHENLHITVNANGTVTVIHDNAIAECK